MVGNSKCVPSDDHDKINKVIWNHAEFNLQNTNADIFEIFDCCYAGNIGRTRGYEKRSDSLGILITLNTKSEQIV